MWQPFHIIQDSCSRCGESRHGLEIGTGDIRDVASDDKRQHAEEGEYNPCGCHQKIAVTTTQVVVSRSAHIFKYEACADGQDG